jgi:hypothetical protein
MRVHDHFKANNYLQVSISASEQRVDLLDGVEKVTAIISRCKIYEGFYEVYVEARVSDQTLDNLKSRTVKLYAAILEFLSFALRRLNSTLSQTIHAILKPNEVSVFVRKFEFLDKQLEKDVENCKQALDIKSQKDVAEKLHKLDIFLRELHQPILRVDSKVGKIWKQLKNDHKNKILKAISTVRFDSNHQDAKFGRTANTCGWLLQHQTYRDWRKSSVSTILWLHGIRKYSS